MAVALERPAALTDENAARFGHTGERRVTAIVLGSAVGRRTAVFGGLALLAVSVFILGAWAGVVRNLAGALFASAR